ncbi:MAG: hypothetical protein ABR583_12895 [Gaiellaceae bacterium]
MLGASSLADAVAQLDNLERAATQDRALIARTRALRDELEALGRSLAARQAEVARLRASAATAAAALSALQTEQAAARPARRGPPRAHRPAWRLVRPRSRGRAA